MNLLKQMSNSEKLKVTNFTNTLNIFRKPIVTSSRFDIFSCSRCIIQTTPLSLFLSPSLSLFLYFSFNLIAFFCKKKWYDKCSTPPYLLLLWDILYIYFQNFSFHVFPGGDFFLFLSVFIVVLAILLENSETGHFF